MTRADSLTVIEIPADLPNRIFARGRSDFRIADRFGKAVVVRGPEHKLHYMPHWGWSLPATS